MCVCVCVCVCVYISPFLLSLLPHPTLPPFHPSRSSQSTGLPMLYSSFLLVLYFTHYSVYMSMLLSQLVLASPSPTVLISPFSTSAFPFLLCK